MARTRTIQTSFNAGEFSPLLEGRTDLAKYHNSAKTIENCLCLKHGGVQRRPGTRFVAEVKDSTKKTRLIPFTFSDDPSQAYIVEIGNQYMRFYKNGARIESPPGTPVEIITPYLEAEIFGVNFAQSADVMYLTHHSHFPSKLERISDTTWIFKDVGDPVSGSPRGVMNGPWLDERIDINFTFSSGTALVASAPYFNKGMIGGVLRMTISATVGYCEITAVTDSLNATVQQVLTMDTGVASTTFQEGAWAIGVPTTSSYVLSATGTGDGIYTGTIVATANSLVGLSVIISGFATSANNGTFIITANNGTTTITTTNTSNVGESKDATATVIPFLRGFPSVVTLYQQRLWFAASDFGPDTIWASQSNDYENFDDGTGLDNEACTFTLASNKVNHIQWLVPSRSFIAGTVGQEWAISGAGGTDTPITPSSVLAIPESTHGSNSVVAIAIENAVLFLQRAGQRLRELSYQFTSDSYIAPDMTLLSEHVTAGGLTQMDYQEEINSILWGIRTDGTLVGMTYERPQDVIAWHRHITGNNGDLSDGQFESVAVIPHPTAPEDQPWMIVNRAIPGTASLIILDWSAVNYFLGALITVHIVAHGLSPTEAISTSRMEEPAFNGSKTVNTVIDADHFTFLSSISGSYIKNGTAGFVTIPTSTKRYVEYFDTQGGYYSYLQVDAGLTYSGAATATLTGLSHLEGQVVDIVGNGAIYPQQVVTSGQVTGLSPEVTKAEVGLHFNSTILTQRPELDSREGTAQGARKRFNEVIVRLDSTIGVTINGEQMEFRTSGDAMDVAVPTFTGDQRVTNLGWDKDGRIEIKQNQSLPFTLIALIGTININD